ncbi:GTP-binding protein [Desulfitobacterium hafniense]
MHVKIIILGGFLGSGKTSVLLQLAKYLITQERDNKSEIKVAILENEIGTVGIDDKILANAGFTVENLFAGCVCCTLAGELVSSVKKMQNELNPAWLIIEATGVAFPGSISKAIFEAIGVGAYILTIVDAKRWRRLVSAMEPLVAGQLEESSQVLVNKKDLVNASELAQVKISVQEYSRAAKVICISAKEEIPVQCWQDMISEMG